MSTTEEELQWEAIEATRPKDKNSRAPEPGALGRGFVRWLNGMPDRVAILHKDRNFNVRVQRLHGGQMHDVSIMTIRTEPQILQFLKEKYPEHLPPRNSQDTFNPAVLPRAVIDAIWGIS